MIDYQETYLWLQHLYVGSWFVSQTVCGTHWYQRRLSQTNVFKIASLLVVHLERPLLRLFCVDRSLVEECGAREEVGPFEDELITVIDLSSPIRTMSSSSMLPLVMDWVFEMGERE
jgi:hypothetical protein